jgi:hypothetical protein
MFKISKLIVAAAIAIAGLAPALARSPTHNQTTAMHHAQHPNATQRSGFYDFATVPPPGADAIPIDPALTGGGSRGYNDNLLKDY